MEQGIVSTAGHHGPIEKVSFEELDLDEIPEFRPRQGTGVESINDSGYSTSLSSSFQDASFLNDQSQYPQPSQHAPVQVQPQLQQPEALIQTQPSHFVPTIPMSVPPPLGQTPSQFYLYSPASNTLIPCEEIMVGQTISSSEGILYQGETKAYVAYPVHGPEGSGYITQPFVHPNYGSGSEDKPRRSEVIDQVPKPGTKDVQPSHAKEKNDGRRKTMSLSSAMPLPGAGAEENQPQSKAEPVYIPGLVTSPTIKKVKKRRKKKPKTKNEHSKMNNSSSESEGKEHGHGLEVETRKAFEEEIFNFVEEPINEINLTDDLANSLLNPPTEDDDMETTIARDILNIVETEVEEDIVSEGNVSLNSGKGNPVNVLNELESIKVEETNENITLEIEIKPKESGSLPNESKFVTKTKKKKPKKPSKNDLPSSEPLSPELMEEIGEDVKNPEIEEVLVLNDTVPGSDELVKDADATIQENCPQVEDTINLNTKDKDVDTPETDIVANAKDNDAVNDEANKENKPRKRRKRGTKDKGGTNNQPFQRVLVIDDQVDIRYHRPTGPLTPSKTEMINQEIVSQSSRYVEVVVKDLGLGMFRGVMELGRPFLGYYRPPDRREYELVEGEEKEEEETRAVELDQD